MPDESVRACTVTKETAPTERDERICTGEACKSAYVYGRVLCSPLIQTVPDAPNRNLTAARDPFRTSSSNIASHCS